MANYLRLFTTVFPWQTARRPPARALPVDEPANGSFKRVLIFGQEGTMLRYIFHLPKLLISIFWTQFATFCRPLTKWLLRKMTGLCELQRICYGEPAGAPRIAGVGN